VGLSQLLPAITVMSHDIYENKIKIWAIKKNVQVKNA
jgi:hypothetical protein